MQRCRLDLALVHRGIVANRSKAQALVLARRVRVNGEYVTKAGAQIADDDQIELVALEHPWVGRGGMKLAGAFESFPLDVAGLVCADLGASTGGFTHVLLEKGASKVFAIDVGYGQLDASLRNDPRVVNREKTNARYLDQSDFETKVDFVSIDVSFIPLALILPAIPSFLAERGQVVALIKPQFEVGRSDVGKGGIVREPSLRETAVRTVEAVAVDLGFQVKGLIESPVKGAAGNVEYLIWLEG